MTSWTEKKLAELPVDRGFRLRGYQMTRLEAFTDAAFAFATTMLIISQSGIPRSVDELALALKDIPAFLAGFVSIASFWYAHRRWSRRYGLEDTPSIILSLGLVFVMLIFVYPLKMVFSAFFGWITWGRLPTSFELRSIADLPRLFVIYGLGFTALMSIIGLLYSRALRTADRLALNELERLRTREEAVSHFVLAATGLASTLWAGLLPLSLGVWAGFFYASLAITMPIVAVSFSRKADGIDA